MAAEIVITSPSWTTIRPIMIQRALGDVGEQLSLEPIAAAPGR